MLPCYCLCHWRLQELFVLGCSYSLLKCSCYCRLSVLPEWHKEDQKVIGFSNVYPCSRNLVGGWEKKKFDYQFKMI